MRFVPRDAFRQLKRLPTLQTLQKALQNESLAAERRLLFLLSFVANRYKLLFHCLLHCGLVRFVLVTILRQQTRHITHELQICLQFGKGTANQ